MAVDLDLDLTMGELVSLPKLGKQLLAEMLGTLILVTVGCGSCMGGDGAGEGTGFDDQSNIVRISFTFGLTVATLAMTIGHVSGCHINPAVTLGLTVTGKVGLVQSCLYIAAQSIGAILGSDILWTFAYGEGNRSTELRGFSSLGTTGLSHGVTPVQGFVIEAMITMILVMVVFGAAADHPNSEKVMGSPPLAIGLAVTTCHLFAIPLTGSSMNPARSLGPAVILGQYSHMWLYWAGPLTGGLLAAILYQAIFAARTDLISNTD